MNDDGFVAYIYSGDSAPGTREFQDLHDAIQYAMKTEGDHRITIIGGRNNLGVYRIDVDPQTFLAIIRYEQHEG